MHEISDTEDERQRGYGTWAEVHHANDKLKELSREGELDSAWQNYEHVASAVASDSSVGSECKCNQVVKRDFTTSRIV